MARTKLFNKIIASLLVLTIAFTAIPNAVYAATTLGSNSQSQDKTQDVTQTVTPEELSQEKILCELTDKRTEVSKEYILNNGHHVTVIYPEPVHYDVDGTWEEIDNTLYVDAKTNGNVVSTSNSPFNVELPTNTGNGKEIFVTYKDYTISFALQTQQNLVTKEYVTKSASLVAGEEKVLSTSKINTRPATVRNNEPVIGDTVNEVATPTKTYSGLTYANVFSGVSLKYDLSPYTLKETIVINSKDVAARSYSFTLNAGTLTPTLLEDGSISLLDSEKGEIFVLQAPYLMDANENISRDIEVVLTKEATLSSKDTNTWTITYNLPSLWMDNATYPVALDPIVQARSTNLSIEDVAVAEKNSDLDTFAYNVMYMRVGKDSYYGRMRSFVKFLELPPLTSGDVVTYAALRLVTPANTSTTSMVVSASKVTSSWNSHTNGTSMTWATQPSISSIVEDYQTVTGQGTYYWDVTDIARDWYQTGVNNGIALTAYNESTSDVKKFYSSDNDGSNPLPMLFVYHINTSGLESYWDYTTVSANRAGVGYVNNFSGNLIWVHEDLGYATNTMPVNIYHVYNSNDAASNQFGMGYGWRTNYNQLVYPYPDKTNYDSNIYVWEDEDGTRHYFEYKSDEECYVDEANTSLTMEVTLNSQNKLASAIITDKQGNTSSFDSLGRLYKIENNQQTSRYISIGHFNDTNRIAYIADGNSREYRFVYSNNLLSRMFYWGYEETTYKTINYTYDSNNNLTKIEYNDGNKDTLFRYSSSHLLTRASQEQDYLLYFYYTTNTAGLTNKVRLIEEEADLNNNTSQGGRITFTYGHNQTTIQDRSGHTNIYQFNYWGNTICIQDDQGNAAFASFANNYYDNFTNTGSNEKKNQLMVSSQLQNTVGNRLRYYSPGSLWDDYWWKLSGYTTGTVTYVNGISHMMSSSIAMNISSPADTPCVLRNGEDDLILSPGETYTFSAYVNTKDVTANTNSRFYLALGLNFPTANHSEYLYIDTPKDEWQRVEVTYKYTGTTTTRIEPYIVFDGVGTIYVDSLQIEEGNSASRLNLVVNNDISYYGTGTSLTNWSRSSASNVQRANITTAITNGTPATESLDNYVIKMTGNPTSEVNSSQTIAISGQSGDCYVFSGWAKGDSAPLTEGTSRTFGIKVDFFYNLNDDTPVGSSTISFNPDMDSTNTWQYAAGAAVATGEYNYIKIYLLYDYNVNTACFDGIQLYKETFGSSFTYDDNGNVKSVVDIQGGKTTYEYENNDLTKQVLPDNTTYTYEYDIYHNVKTATSPTGIKYTFEYDEYGNNTAVYAGVDGNEKQMGVIATYTKESGSLNGAFLASITDTTGNRTEYGYDTEESLLLWIKNPEDTEETRTEYIYDEQYRVIATSKKVGQDTAIVGSTFTVDLLSVLTHTNNSEEDTTAYAFAYGKFDMLSSITVGGEVLVNYTYNNLYERYLSAITYGNGDGIKYSYDEQGRTTSVTYTSLEDFASEPSLKYTYDQAGRLIKVEDLDANTITQYSYDLTSRLMRYEVKQKLTGSILYATEYTYNQINNLESLKEVVNDETSYTSYTYNQDNKLVEFSKSSELNLDVLCQLYTYDSLGRLTKITTQENFGNVVASTLNYKAPDYEYAQELGVSTTTILSQWINKYGRTTTGYYYQFDKNGNITEISPDNDFNDSDGVEYSYDSLNQLVRVDDAINSETWTYTYDLGGNILSKSRYAYTQGTLETALETITYSYGDNSWGDLLTSYNGNLITYDQIGNPLSDGTWAYEWEHGRQLAEQSNGITTWTYTYDASGQRTSKSNGQLSYYYIYDGISLKYLRIANETTDETVCEMYFEYGKNGLVAIQYISSSLTDTFYAVINAQGDIVSLVDGTGTIVVNYSYSAWGELKSITGSLANTVGTYNPIRYRGYVYDTETELYYLNSRYYNPEWGRFLNADGYTSTGQGLTAANNFAYCGNNPVTRRDISGNAWETVWDIISLGTSIAEVVANPTNLWAWAGLAGDVVDVAVPFFGGIGEIVDALRVSKNAAEAVDDMYDAARIADKIEDANDAKKIANKVDFYVTPNGEAIPASLDEFNNNLSKLENIGGKYVGKDSSGPIRIISNDIHLDNPNFTGAANPLHTIPHFHIDRRINGNTGSWYHSFTGPMEMFK